MLLNASAFISQNRDSESGLVETLNINSSNDIDIR